MRILRRPMVVVIAIVALLIAGCSAWWNNQPRRHHPPTTTTTSITSATLATTTTVVNNPNTIFSDEFNGTSLDTTKWYISNSCANFVGVSRSCPATFNVSVAGGNLRLRITRASSSFRGALISSIDYENGYAPYYPKWTKVQWQGPHTISIRALMPPTQGAWPALWLRSDTGEHELDIAEERMTFPTRAGCHQHQWKNGVNARPQYDSEITVPNMATNWHIYSAIVNSASVTYKVDNQICGVAWGIPNDIWYGVILNNMIGDPGSWGSGEAQPSSTDPGPWDLLVDYVRVTK